MTDLNFVVICPTTALKGVNPSSIVVEMRAAFLRQWPGTNRIAESDITLVPSSSWCGWFASGDSDTIAGVRYCVLRRRKVLAFPSTNADHSSEAQ